MEKLTKNDAKKYLGYGALSQPFLKNEYVVEKVMHDFVHKKSAGVEITEMESLYNWIRHNIKSGDEDFNNQFKFQRSAKEIWESGISTGCSDYALLFAVFARQIGIPTTFLGTAEKSWLERLLSNRDYASHHYGHSFCECFYEDKWVLVDPTFRKIVYDYECDKIVLPYDIGPSNEYVPYFRGLDWGKKETIKQHNNNMDKSCRGIQL